VIKLQKHKVELINIENNCRTKTSRIPPTPRKRNALQRGNGGGDIKVFEVN
jgi:hypothetical protein